MWTEDDVRFMREALNLAKSAEGRTTPDPMVGAVLVKEGRIISMGYHDEVATPHAEAWAIDKAGPEAKGATLYVNLEPCSHYGNNPPCANRIVNSGIKEVFVAMKDPNPLVNGRGLRTLKKGGVKVNLGLLEDEARQLNEVFIKFITKKSPFVLMKSAITLDGKIATRTGASRWVASNASRRFAHHLRNLYDSILVGVGTVLIDNPKLNVRMVKKVKDPIRLVLDSYARTPLRAKVLSRGIRTIIVTGPKAPKSRIEALRRRGAEILTVSAPQGKIDLKELMKKLAKMNITSVMVEGGGEVNASFLEAGLVDKAIFVVAPKIFGGRDAKTCVEGGGVARPSQAIWLKKLHLERLEEDILISGYFK
ncbi:MAG: bifunctional diaminohydroxyphosphoribosylaminopyrimidine deaminase/5-amino-6-(5-phosphoribosylamino)uracil reductase RibD, partial [Candidatus Margulisbacteria bacterium]|nr:bifunctional diaminohydroxyphosphoribosylaminopyrimidine deaminase/5-amino-6-(5-phosphoribosylamino)uracil reductase RibD [Candidatus Margulisiibacteriota bacterium]